jgi:hypothetical protein
MQLTTITDTLQNPAGQPLYGTITIKNPATFTSADGFVVPGGGDIASVTVSNGTFTVAVIPHAGGTPPGASYQASYSLGTAVNHPTMTMTETWVVPVSATPVNLLAVRTLPQ